MNFVICGRFSLSPGPTPNFGSLPNVSPKPTPSFMLICKADQSRPDDQVLQFQYDWELVDLALGLCTWLSYQSVGSRIKHMTLKLLEDDAEKFAKEFVHRMSASTNCTISGPSFLDPTIDRPRPPQTFQAIANLLLAFPQLLKFRGENSENTGDFETSLSMYDSARHALQGWLKYRDSKAKLGWQTLLLEVMTYRLRILRLLKKPVDSIEQRMLDNGRDFAQSLTTIPINTRVTFLQEYIFVKEQWGQKGSAFILSAMALRLSPQSEQLKADVRRLRAGASAEIELMKPFGNIFYLNPDEAQVLTAEDRIDVVGL